MISPAALRPSLLKASKKTPLATHTTHVSPFYSLFFPESGQRVKVGKGCWLDSGSCLALFVLGKKVTKGFFRTLMESEKVMVNVGWR